ncbi:MAG TPA: AAA family ATPase [Longimicrobium sp.]
MDEKRALGAAVELCRRVWADRARCDREERDYKLAVARRVREALQAVQNGGDYLPILRRAFASPNNLTSYRVHGPFLTWAQANPEQARAALRHLMSGDDPRERIDRFLAETPAEAVPGGTGNRLSLASFFLFGQQPEQFPIFRHTPFNTVERVLRFPVSLPGSTPGQVYGNHVTFAQKLRGALQEAGIHVRDMLDVQSLIFILSSRDDPEFTSWRNGASPVNDLASLVERFREERGYPTTSDDADLRARAEWEAYLRDQLETEQPDWHTLQWIISSGTYGNPGPQSTLNGYINTADEEGSRALQRTLRRLLLDDEPLARRLDDVLEGGYRIRGLGESGAMKLVSIVHPDRVLPVFPFGGEKGKAALMRHPSLNLTPPVPGTASRGQLAERSNEMLRARLEPYFGTDTHGMKEFLYWLSYAQTPPNGSGTEDRLPKLADELLVSEAFLREVVDLLRDKCQIIFYGPPGTGKTYIARKLMEHLAPGRHTVVQFHPAYGYEDFVQGYRPVSDAAGSLGYRLKPGPLLQMARAADAARDHEHVMLIDEINRGNLPRIFGELLYLLEYRDSDVALTYAEEGELFSLPGNLKFIGTMNTADRSIALVDAALRRRFHFVPLFPGEEPLDGFLDRWLQRHHPEMAYVARLVDRLNERLRRELNANLQVGHSHFTRKDLSPAVLQRVWKYDVMPFLQDQLFGQERELERFTLEHLLAETNADDRPEGAPAGGAPAGAR